MMGIKVRSFAALPRDLSLEDLVPEDHFYRRLEARLDLSFVRELVAPFYAGGGRPSVDPVVFFKLQLVMFFEDLRSERQLMRAVADRLSLRWYLGYDLHESLPDHSSLTRIRERYGLEVFRGFFERIVEECFDAGLVRGEELFFDATKVEADAAVDSLAPRWFVEGYLHDLFEEDARGHHEDPRYVRDADDAGSEDEDPVGELPTAGDRDLTRANSEGEDWISRGGAQDRSFEGAPGRQRTADRRASRTDPDATPMRWSENARKLGYRTNYVIDGGKARVILSVVVTPGEVTENRPMLDLLRHACFRWKLRPHHVTGDGTYGTIENIAGVERSGIRAYLGLHEAGGRGLLPQERLRLRSRRGPLPLPVRGGLEGFGRRRRRPQAGQGRHLPGEGFGVRWLLPQAGVHHQQERPFPQAPPRGRVRGPGQSVHADGVVPQGDTQAQGVDRAFVRGGEALARDGPVPDEEAREDQLRGSGDSRGAEHEAAARLRWEEAEEAGAGGGAAACADRTTARPRQQRTTGPSPRTMPRFSVFQQAGTFLEQYLNVGYAPRYLVTEF
jgi:transposase